MKSLSGKEFCRLLEKHGGLYCVFREVTISTENLEPM